MIKWFCWKANWNMYLTICFSHSNSKNIWILLYTWIEGLLSFRAIFICLFSRFSRYVQISSCTILPSLHTFYTNSFRASKRMISSNKREFVCMRERENEGGEKGFLLPLCGCNVRERECEKWFNSLLMGLGT